MALRSPAPQYMPAALGGASAWRDPTSGRMRGGRCVTIASHVETVIRRLFVARKSSAWLRHTGFALISAAMLGACGGGGDNDSGGGSGTVTLRITDAPVDNSAVEHVYVQFSSIELQGEGGRTVFYYCQDPADSSKTIVSTSPCVTPKPRQIDLLALNGGLSDELLEGQTVPAGRYPWIRLAVDTSDAMDSYIVVSGSPHELTIPSGNQTGLKLIRGFIVPAGGHADFTIDFDLRKSVHVTATGEHVLRPVLRMVDNSQVGRIVGTVAASLVTAGCSPAVYVFAGAAVTPDDIDGNAVEPLTTATVRLDGGVYRYTAAFLEIGSYTVAYSCQAAADDPATDDALAFSATATVAVAANAITVHNFE